MQTHSALTVMLAAAYAGLDDKGIEGSALLEADQAACGCTLLTFMLAA
jgi:hypothetical protein